MSTPYIKNIQLKRGGPISLQRGEILALVGPNNSGKTHFLKQLASIHHGIPVDEVDPNSGPIKDSTIGWDGTDNEVTAVISSRVKQHFNSTPNGFYFYPGARPYTTTSVNEATLQNFRPGHDKLGVFTDLFLEFDNALDRISETDLKALQPRNPAKSSSLTQLARDSTSKSDLIRHFFRQIFHREISYYDRGDGSIGFILAPVLPDASPSGSAFNEKTKNHMESSPKMWLQGLGMRSVLGMLLKIFAGGKDIILIDEPEAFLHPPQASALGNALVKISQEHSKQFIITTHDRNLLNGLTNNSSAMVNIQRLSRSSNTSDTTSRQIDSTTLANVREKSLIRYTPILDSLFSKLTILVENEKDAFFYSECISHLLDQEPDEYPEFSINDILFLSTSGKNAMPRTAALLASLHSHVVTVCDHDLLTDRRVVEGLITAINGPGSELPAMKSYREWENSVFPEEDNQSKREKLYKTKEPAMVDPQNPLFDLSEKVRSDLDMARIHLNPVGELEDFAIELVEKNGKAFWAHEAIQEGVHKRDAAVSFARRMLSSIHYRKNSSCNQLDANY